MNIVIVKDPTFPECEAYCCDEENDVDIMNYGYHCGKCDSLFNICFTCAKLYDNVEIYSDMQINEIENLFGKVSQEKIDDSFEIPFFDICSQWYVYKGISNIIKISSEDLPDTCIVYHWKCSNCGGTDDTCPD